MSVTPENDENFGSKVDEVVTSNTSGLENSEIKERGFRAARTNVCTPNEQEEGTIRHRKYPPASPRLITLNSLRVDTTCAARLVLQMRGYYQRKWGVHFVD